MSREKSNRQQTIKKEVLIEGAGIHTGVNVSVRLKPAPEDSGIIFLRTDIKGAPAIPASVDFVSACRRGTTLSNGAAEVMTVEHLMAALYGLEIDNLYIEISSKELPACDGSSAVYTEKIMQAGIKRQEAERLYCALDSPLVYTENDAAVIAIPSDRLSVNAVFDYEEGLPGGQYASVDISVESFLSEMAGARTFCFEKDIEHIKKQGLGLGGSEKNTLVIRGNSVKNTPLRFDNECVRHKILDFTGDLSLLGCPLKARIFIIKTGHQVNINFTKKLKKYFMDKKLPQKKIDSEGILKILPHRYPFLMVDTITVGADGKTATGYKNVTSNEPFFKGHFPDTPIFPSTLIIEFMAQSSAVLFLSGKKSEDTLAYFMIIEDASFFGKITPPEILRAEVELIQMRGTRGKVQGTAYKENGEITAQAQFMFALVER